MKIKLVKEELDYEGPSTDEFITYEVVLKVTSVRRVEEKMNAGTLESFITAAIEVNSDNALIVEEIDVRETN